VRGRSLGRRCCWSRGGARAGGRPLRWRHLLPLALHFPFPLLLLHGRSSRRLGGSGRRGGRRWRRWGGARRRRGRGRRHVLWRGGRRRWCWRRRPRCCGRGGLRRFLGSFLGSFFGRALGWLLRLPVRTQFLLGLRNDERRGLGVGGRGRKLQRRESRGGEQQESRFCHDGFGPGGFLMEGLRVLDAVLLAGIVVNTDDQQTSVRPDCGDVQTAIWIYFRRP
jgi:hypothetical protein